MFYTNKVKNNFLQFVPYKDKTLTFLYYTNFNVDTNLESITFQIILKLITWYGTKFEMYKWLDEQYHLLNNE